MGAIKDLSAALVDAVGLRPSARAVLAKAESLVGQGRYLDAIAYATDANRRLRDPALERRLVQWRHEACAAIPHPPGRPDWPPVMADPFPNVQGPPEVRGAEALTVERLGGGILHHGCLIVRGLFSAEEAERLRSGIELALVACAEAKNGRVTTEDERWYAPFPMVPDTRMMHSRLIAEALGCLLTADSPRVQSELIALISEKGVDRVIEGYLGERPVLSIGKSTLRRVPPQAEPNDWHQDGAFLGETIRTVNFWLALSHCGEDASGLDMVPRRIPNIVQTGTHGAQFYWTVGRDVADELAAGLPTASPNFAPGDAVFFDQLFLHRTAGNPRLSKDRYAIETWFFAPSTYPEGWGPLLI